METELRIIAVSLSLLLGILFLLIAVKPKKILTIVQSFFLFPGKARDFKEAYSMAEKKVDAEDNGCLLVGMVVFGLLGFSIAVCNLLNLI
ncbi:MAG: hypothetical protein HPY85_11715 [Anaerolineae bacterium]|nr:hypothetical protein [Anaerolineae bacterium]